MNNKKVIIMGFAPTWKDIKFDDTSFELWTLNEAYEILKETGRKADRWFEIHNPNSPSKSTPEHQEFLKTTDIPVYMQDKIPEYPSSVKYPIEEVLQFFDRFNGRHYFTNSISWMIGLAIYEGYDTIHVYGVDMAAESEYSYQKPSCEYLIGIAEGMGINVYVPPESELLKAAQLYGFESDNGMRLKMKERKKEMKERRKKYQKQKQEYEDAIKQCDQAINQLLGAEDDLNYWINNWAR